MVDVQQKHPLDQFLATHNSTTSGDVTVEVRRGHGMAHLFASKGKIEEMTALLSIGSTPALATASRSMTALPLSPAEWLAISAKPDTKSDFASRLSKKIKGAGFVSEQSDARVIFRISGPRTIELLQKECRLDLQSKAVGKNWCASTQMAHIGVILHCIDDKPSFDLYVYSGFSEDFANWIWHSGQQLGVVFSGK